ncbi:MAG: oxygenase MpaB family protein [Pseudonocardiales bacterium]|nr:oxygenase MpaB family protein [Pseudonocardiales bacterium]
MSAAPEHDPPVDGYFGPGSATRRVIGDPAALIGGFSALFLQALHPRAMAGVEQHSSFPDDFWPRLERTAGYVTTLAFADRATADRSVARVRAMHRRVRGTDPVTGLAYSADDPDLLRWVHVCEVGSFAAAVRRLGLIDAAEEDRFLAEQVRAGALLGATDLPASRAEVDAYFAAVRPELVASPIARRAARRLAVAPLPAQLLPVPPRVRATPGVGAVVSAGDVAARLALARPVWSAVAAVAVGLMPAWARELYGVPRPPGGEAVTTAGLAALRAALLGVRRARGLPAPPR